MIRYTGYAGTVVAILKEQGKTQIWLNAKMDAGKNCVGQMLASNNPTLSRLTEVAHALNMEASDLLERMETQS